MYVIAESCDEFHCRGEEYCIDTSRVLCNPLPRYCISMSLRCDGVPNCGVSDHSDEEGCEIITANISHTRTNQKQREWIGHVRRRDPLLRYIIEGRIPGKRPTGTSHQKTLHWMADKVNGKCIVISKQ